MSSTPFHWCGAWCSGTGSRIRSRAIASFYVVSPGYSGYCVRPARTACLEQLEANFGAEAVLRDLA